MNKWIAAGLVLLVASPLAVVALDAAGIGPGFRVNAPAWESGYTWTYDVDGQGRASGQIFGIVSAETETGRFEATRRAEVMNTTIHQGDVPLYAVFEAFRLDRVLYGDKVIFDGDEDSYQNAAPHVDEFSSEFFCLTPCGTFLAQYTRAHANPYLGPELGEEQEGLDTIRLLDFPLTRDKQWTVLKVDESEGDHRFLLEITATAVAEEYINPPGTKPLEAIRIEAKITDASKEALKALASQAAANEEITLDADFDLTFTYWYAPEIQNIARMDTTGFVAAQAAGFGAAGAGRVDFSAKQIIDSWSLVAKPERTLAEANAIATAAWADGGDVATSVAPQTWAFTAAASELSANAADGQTITLGTTDGWGGDDQTTSFANPHDARVEWTHKYYRDLEPVTERLAGATTDVTIDAPGRHIFTARAYDSAGRLLGADDLVVEGYTEMSCRADDVPVGMGIGGPVSDTETLCTIPVAPGMTRATFAKTPDILAEGTLHVLRDGEEVASGELDEPLTIENIDMPGTWTLDWQDFARAGGLTVDIEVRYDRTPAPAAPTPGGFGSSLIEMIARLG